MRWAGLGGMRTGERPASAACCCAGANGSEATGTDHA